MSKTSELRDAVEAIRSRIVTLGDMPDEGDGAITDEERAEFATLTTPDDAGKTALDRAAEAYDAECRRVDVLDKARKMEVRSVPGVSPQFMRQVEVETRDVLSLNKSQVRDGALALLDKRAEEIDTASGDQITKMLRGRLDQCDSSEIARRMLVTENEDYRSGFMKVVTRAHPFLTAEEGRAMQQYEEYRAASIGTTTAGGFGVPVLIDPTIILVSQGTPNPVAQISTVKTVTVPVWRGVSSVGSSWSFDGEAAEVSDDTPVLAQPIVTTHKAQASVPFSIEVSQDYPGFAGEMSMVLAEGYAELLSTKFINGTGTIEPRGVLVALDATSASEVVTLTDGEFNEADVYAVWAALPQRFRGNASWLMHTSVENEIRKFGGDFAHDYTVNLMASGIPQLFGRPVYVSDYMTTYTSTTAAENILIAGDFRQGFYIAQRAGMEVELVPHLFATNANLPNGQRAWYAWARVGSNLVAANALRLLQNQ
jgi:HK97 family phage major capsid protein